MHIKFSQSLALFGIGQWGKNLARIYHSLGALHTICDFNQVTLEDYQLLYSSVHMTNNVLKTLENKEIDKVVIATPAHQHFEIAKIALENHKDVFVEKPLCLDPKQGQILVELAKKNRRILMVGHLYHYHPAFIALKTLIHQGKLGELKYIAAHRLKLGKFRQEENVLWSFSPHDLSIILSLADNQMPIHLECTGTSFVTKNVHDIVTATIEFKSGLKAHLFASWVHPFKEQKIVVVGTKGMAVLDDTQALQQKLKITQGMIDLSKDSIPTAVEGQTEFITLPEEESLQNECLHFLTCCHERMTPISDGQEGLRVLKTLEMCQSKLTKNHTDQQDYYSHETAVIENKAMIGKNSKIWHYSTIRSGAIIGSNCSLGQNVVVFPGARLGNNCKVQNNISIFSGVICEDDVFLGPSMVFTNVLNPRSSVCRKDQFKTTLVRKGVTIGANATIVCGIELGEHSFIGAGSVVTKSTQPYALMVGNPARQVGWMSQYGEKLDLPLFSEDLQEAFCPATNDKYTLIKNRLVQEVSKINPT